MICYTLLDYLTLVSEMDLSIYSCIVKLTLLLPVFISCDASRFVLFYVYCFRDVHMEIKACNTYIEQRVFYFD